MGSHWEIVELNEEPKLNDSFKKIEQAKLNDKGKKFQGSKSIENDINKLFEGINVRSSFHGFTLPDEMTPRRNPSKKPMRMSTSGIGYTEPVSLKQALRGLSISHASEMAAMKRLSKVPGSPALSESGRLPNVYKASECTTCVPEIKELQVVVSEESTSRKTPEYQQEPKMKSYNTSPMSTKKVATAVRLNQILQEPETASTVQDKKVISISSGSCNIAAAESSNSGSEDMPIKSVSMKLRRKGKSPSCTSTSNSKLVKSTRVKAVIRNKNIVKNKSKPSATKENITNTSQPVCQRCHCDLKEPIPPPCTSSRTEVHYLKRNNGAVKHDPTLTSCGTNAYSNTISKSGDKSEFTQSSNSSICEYSSSTSISEDSNMSRYSIGNRPHMSMDIRWQAIQNMMKQNGFMGLRHFNLLKKLGCGDIGTVYLAELVGTNCLFAIKVMDNEFLERRKKMPRAHTEREILRMLDHPFLPTLYAHFVSESLSCLVMEYCPGGDLHVLRQKQPGRFYHEQAARFYVAEVLLALEYLHMLGIIYRDLKPENILVRQDGHIMLTDFDLSLRCTVNPTLLQSPSLEPPRMSGPCAGSNCIDPFCIDPTCKVSCFSPRILHPHRTRKTKPSLHRSLPQLVAEPTEARSNSFVGTHEYLAPEIIKGDGHGSAVDWWTFGIFLYELLYGKTPFKGSGNDETLANVVLQSLKFPDTPLVSFQARDLIKGLLVKEPENRLGSQRGAAEIKRHPFFEDLNWALIRCAIPPEVPESYDIGMEKANLEFELF